MIQVSESLVLSRAINTRDHASHSKQLLEQISLRRKSKSNQEKSFRYKFGILLARNDFRALVIPFIEVLTAVLLSLISQAEKVMRASKYGEIIS